MFTYQITWKYKGSDKSYNSLVRADDAQEAINIFEPSSLEVVLSLKVV